MKHTARKVRRLYGGRVLVGFAGAAADAMTLYDRFEAKLEEFHGQLLRAATELTRDWRSDRVLRRLEALMLAVDGERILVLSGAGDIYEPDDGVAGIGSGGGFAVAAARALVRHSDLTAEEIAREAMGIAASLCVYTNDVLTVETVAVKEA